MLSVCVQQSINRKYQDTSGEWSMFFCLLALQKGCP